MWIRRTNTARGVFPQKHIKNISSELQHTHSEGTLPAKENASQMLWTGELFFKHQARTPILWPSERGVVCILRGEAVVVGNVVEGAAHSRRW